MFFARFRNGLIPCIQSRYVQLRYFSVDIDTSYEEIQQQKQIKSSSFYAKHGENRDYFYHIDSQGRLFTEEVIPKNIATSIKADKFLDFFFRRIKQNTLNRHTDYPFVSPCGAEMNFIKAADTPIVFHDLQETDGKWNLLFGSSIKVPFDPELLRVSLSGRLYHLDTKSKIGGYALIKSHLSISLAENITIHHDDSQSENNGTHQINWQGKISTIRVLNEEKRI
eukprot:GSMAST32.ASY1.ANO1.1241.1 assembled CDS